MSTLSTKTALDHRWLQYGRWGSFWNESFDGQGLRQMHALVQMAGNSGATALARGMMSRTAPAEPYGVAAPSLRNADSSYLGPDIQQRIRRITPIFGLDILARPSPADVRMPASGGMVLETEQSYNGAVGILQDQDWQYVFFPADADTYDPERLAEDFVGTWLQRSVDTPLHIRDTTGNDYVAGVHFWPRCGAVTWHRNPTITFPDNRCAVMTAIGQAHNVFNYTWQVDELPFGGRHIAQYLQDRASVDIFGKALAEACGFYVVPTDDTIVATYRQPAGIVYEFADSGMVRLDYPHVELEAGDTVTEGDILGSPIRIFRSTGLGDNDWWHLSALERIGPDDTIPALPFRVTFTRSCMATCAEESVTDDGTKRHARLNLPAESPADLNRFWGSVKRSELLTGKFLNDVVGLSGIGDSKLVEPLNLCFEHFLGQRGIVVQRYGSEHWGDDRRRRFAEFCGRARPSLSVIIMTNVSAS